MRRWLLGIAVLAMASTTYQNSIRAWQQHRDAGLRAPDGWLTLVGLFWLKQGGNTIGSAASNDFVVPQLPAHAGTFHLQGDKIAFGQKNLSYDDQHPDIVQTGTLSFLVIKRAGRFAVRVRDTASPVRKNFRGMQYFPIDPAFHFQAKLVPDVKKIPILNIIGQTELEESPGWVEFTFKGRPYRLRPIYEETANGRTLYFLFKDTTNKTQTYQAGRMLNTPLAVHGVVDLDFNRSYTPPCAFTPYATCPLPPKENRLPIAIEAGELRKSGTD
jgi:uncharacterized protein